MVIINIHLYIHSYDTSAMPQVLHNINEVEVYLRVSYIRSSKSPNGILSNLQTQQLSEALQSF